MVFKSIRDALGSNKPGIEASQDYQDWRKTIFTIPFDRDDPTPDMKQVESVIVDMGMPAQGSSPSWAITLSVVTSNIATFYLTSGDNVFDVGRQQPKAARAAAELIHMARELQPRTQPTRDTALPAPGVIQFFFVTRSGRSVFASPVQEVQQPGHPFQPLLERFTVIRQVAEQILEERRALQSHMSKIGAVYVMAFTPEQMDQDSLKKLAQEAADHLKRKNPAFKQRFDGKPPQAKLEITNIQFLPFTHTPKNMQALMSDWLRQGHNVTFEPKEEENFFFHGMRNPQGRQNIFLFYFDFE